MNYNTGLLFLCNVDFHFRFLYKSDFRISCLIRRYGDKLELNTFQVRKNYFFFHTFDQIKVSRVPLWKKQALHKGHLNLHLQFLKKK